MPRPDVTNTAEKLMAKVREVTNLGSDIMKPSDLHVTLRYKRSPGPDLLYDREIDKLGPQKVTIRNLYYDRHRAFCSVNLNDKSTEQLSCG